jgi:hypothetical protein
MRPHMRPTPTIRAIIITCAAALVVTACNDDHDKTTDSTNVTDSTSTSGATIDAPTTSSTSTTTTVTTRSTTTSTKLLTVTTPSTGPPGTGPIESEDFVSVIQGLLDRRDQINSAPDPARAGEVYAGGPRYFTFENQLATAQQAGQRTVDVDRTIVLSAEVVKVLPSDELGEFVEVAVVQQYPANWGRIVDADGNTVFDLVPDPRPAEPTVEVRYTLNRPPALGSWLIAFINGE